MWSKRNEKIFTLIAIIIVILISIGFAISMWIRARRGKTTIAKQDVMIIILGIVFILVVTVAFMGYGVFW